jgi:hypothetical protein
VALWSDSTAGMQKLDLFLLGLDGSAQKSTQIQFGFGNAGVAATCAGSGCLVVYAGNNGQFPFTDNLGASRVSPALSVLDHITLPAGCYAPTVTTNGSDFAVAWIDGRSGNQDIYGARISSSGILLDGQSNGRPIEVATGNQSSPQIVFRDTGYLVLWSDAMDHQITGERLDGGYTPLDAMPFAVTAPNGTQITPSVAVAGDHFYPVWVAQ